MFVYGEIMAQKKKSKSVALVPAEIIESKILLIRGKKIMLDPDLAQLYGAETRVLIQAVKRKISRFPEEFMFQLTKKEHESLRSQSVISKKGRGGRRYPPYAFTQEGVAMLSSVLNSERAIHVNVQIMKTFIKLREMLSSHDQLRKKIESMEKKYDAQFKAVFAVIKELLEPPEKPIKKIGF